MFISKLKRQYLVYLAAAFVARLHRIVEIFHEPNVVLGLIVTAFVITTLAFLLFCGGFCISLLIKGAGKVLKSF